jgi:hypothetical protein
MDSSDITTKAVHIGETDAKHLPSLGREGSQLSANADGDGSSGSTDGVGDSFDA